MIADQHYLSWLGVSWRYLARGSILPYNVPVLFRHLCLHSSSWSPPLPLSSSLPQLYHYNLHPSPSSPIVSTLLLVTCLDLSPSSHGSPSSHLCHMGLHPLPRHLPLSLCLNPSPFWIGSTSAQCLACLKNGYNRPDESRNYRQLCWKLCVYDCLCSYSKLYVITSSAEPSNAELGRRRSKWTTSC